MPEEQTQETQLLQAFIDSSLPVLSPETALQVYAAARQYRYLREELDRQGTNITQALQSDDPSALVSLLSKLFRGVVIDLQQAPQLQSEPDEKKTQREIEMHASHIEESRQQSEEILAGKNQSLKEKRAIFAQQLTENFIAQSRRVLEEEEKRRLATKIEEKLTTVANTGDIRRTVETMFTTDPEVSHLVSPVIISQVLQASQPQEAEFIQELQAHARTSDVVLAAQARVLQQPEISNPDLFLSLAAEEAASSTDTPDNIVEKAAALTRVAGVLSQTISTEEGVSRPVVFFRAMAKNPIQKALAPIADAALNLGIVPQETREAIMQEVFHRSWEKIARDTDSLNARFGNAVVQSPFFQQALSHGNTIFAPSGRTPTQGIVGGLVNIGVDVSTAVFGSPRETLITYLDLARRSDPNLGGPRASSLVFFHQAILERRLSVWHVYFAQAFGAHPGRFHLEFLSDLGNWILRLGTKKAGAAAVGKLATTTVAKRILSGAIGRILGGIAGLAAGPVGAIIGSIIGGKVGGILMGAAKGFFSFFTGGLLSRLMYGSGKLDWKKDWVVIFLILLFVVLIALVSPFSAFNPSLAEDEDRMTSLAISLSGEELFDSEGSRFIKLTKTATPESFPDNNPMSVTYAVIIEATETTLTNIQISDVFSVSGGTGTISAPVITTPGQITPGSPFQATFQVALSQGNFSNSVISNTLTVTADVGDTKGESRSTTTTVVVGQPATGCFALGTGGTSLPGGTTRFPNISSEWVGRQLTLIYGAIAQLSMSPSYMAALCGTGQPIMVYRVSINSNFGGFAPGSRRGTIIMYDSRGLLSQNSTNYTLAHESGHILAQRRPDLLNEFSGRGLARTRVVTYPFWNCDKTDPVLGEDFAETIGLYVVWKYYRFSPRSRCVQFPGGVLDFPGRYPLHYDFARTLFIIEYR